MSYWACAQLETRRERTALYFLSLNGFKTYCPRIRTERPSRARESSTWLFPGYAFVWIELQWHAARWSPGVIRLVSSGDAELANLDREINAVNTKVVREATLDSPRAGKALQREQDDFLALRDASFGKASYDLQKALRDRLQQLLDIQRR